MDASVAAHPPLSYLYREHRARAVAIARRILGDAAEAEDVVQDVFSRLVSSGARYQGKAAYSTWLFRIMVNASINSMRSRRRRSQLELEPASSPDPEQQASGRELQSFFEGALKTLGAQHQQVICLRELRGFSYAEISQMLKIPEGTVKSALHRGRLQLSARLAEVL